MREKKKTVCLSEAQISIISSGLRLIIHDKILSEFYDDLNSLLTTSEIKRRVYAFDEVIAINHILKLLGEEEEQYH